MKRAIVGAILGCILLGIPLVGFTMDATEGYDAFVALFVAVVAVANLGALIGGVGAIVAAIDRCRPPQSPTHKPDNDEDATS